MKPGSNWQFYTLEKIEYRLKQKTALLYGLKKWRGNLFTQNVRQSCLTTLPSTFTKAIALKGDLHAFTSCSTITLAFTSPKLAAKFRCFWNKCPPWRPYSCLQPRLLTLGRSCHLSNDCPQIMLQHRDKIKLRYIFPAKMSFNVFMTLSSQPNKDNFLMCGLYETLKMCYRYRPWQRG